MEQDFEAAVVIGRLGNARLDPVGLVDFSALVQQHQPRIYRVLLGMLHDPDAAETLTQECFLKAFQNRGGFRGEASVGTWLVRIAINLARDHRRNRLRAFWQKLFAASKDVTDIRRKSG